MRPRSWSFHSAYATASPCSPETSTPLRREGISAFIGPYSSNTWLMRPLPRVRLRNSDWKPIDPRARHRQLVAFAAHVLQENREVQLAAPRDEEHVGVGCLLHAQGDVALQLAEQAFPQLPAGDEAPFLPGEGRGVDLEVHGERGLVDAEHRQRLGSERVGESDPDRGLLHPGHEHDVAYRRLVHRDSFQAAKTHDLADLGLRGLATLVQHQDLLSGPEPSPGDAPDADAPHVARVIDVADLQLQRAVGVALRRLNALDDRPEKRPHVRSRPRQVERRGTKQGRSVDDRKVELMLRGA